jgi:SAM-dependent methyltransferase
MNAEGEGFALDIGSGTGYSTYQVFGDRPTACIDLHGPNLDYHRQQMAVRGAAKPEGVISLATSLPFESGSFRYILCSEVLEHLEEDEAAVAEIARVLRRDGTAVVTVPYTGMGYTSFLERFGIKTVHDFPGPEFHVRQGYDEYSLAALLSRHDLELVKHEYYLRFFTRVLVDAVSLSHIVYQRFARGRRSWTWADATETEGTFAFRAYTWMFPALRTVTRADSLLAKARGFGLVARIRRAGTGD